MRRILKHLLICERYLVGQLLTPSMGHSYHISETIYSLNILLNNFDEMLLPTLKVLSKGHPIRAIIQVVRKIISLNLTYLKKSLFNINLNLWFTKYTFARLLNNPTDPFRVLESQNPLIDVSELRRECVSLRISRLENGERVGQEAHGSQAERAGQHFFPPKMPEKSQRGQRRYIFVPLVSSHFLFVFVSLPLLLLLIQVLRISFFRTEFKDSVD